jgi:hypothetical protein
MPIRNHLDLVAAPAPGEGRRLHAVLSMSERDGDGFLVAPAHGLSMAATGLARKTTEPDVSGQHAPRLHRQALPLAYWAPWTCYPSHEHTISAPVRHATSSGAPACGVALRWLWPLDAAIVACAIVPGR